MAALRGRLKDERGFALAIAVFALVLLAAVVAGGYFSASQEFQIGRGMRSLTSSFYAGEAGIQEVMDDWDPRVYFALNPGQSITIGPKTFPGGGSYTATVTRVGRAADDVKRYFYIEAVGRPPGPSLGARRQAMTVRARWPILCCQAALKVAEEGNLTPGGPDRIYGDPDSKPSIWPDSVCTGLPSGALPGVVAEDTMLVNPRSKIFGSPVNVIEDPSIPENVINFPDYLWNELVAEADHSRPFGPTLDGSSSRSVVGTECNRDDPMNWGAPQQPSHPCFDYFPIIHVDTLRITNGVAQGIFLVEDVVSLQNADVYGLILAIDDMSVQGPSNFYGHAWVADDLDMSGAVPRFWLSQCAAHRAVLMSRLTQPRPVSQRAWVELF
jgi:hypothetical protein